MQDRTVPTVLIAGDQLLREGLKQLSGGIGLMALAEAASIDDMLNQSAEDLTPELIVLLDWKVGDTDFIESLQRLRSRFPASRLVVLSENSDARGLLEALNAGVDGYLHRNMSSAALLHSIRLVMWERLSSRPVGNAAVVGRAGKRCGKAASGRSRRPVAARNRHPIAACRGAAEQGDRQPPRHHRTTVKVAAASESCARSAPRNRTQAAIWALGYLGKDRLATRPMAQ